MWALKNLSKKLRTCVPSEVYTSVQEKTQPTCPSKILGAQHILKLTKCMLNHFISCTSRCSAAEKVKFFSATQNPSSCSKYYINYVPLIMCYLLG